MINNLADFVEEISSDFQSTFLVRSNNILQNMLGHKDTDFDVLKDIIRKYIPNAKVTYTKLNLIEKENMPLYDCYLIEVKND